MHELMPTIAAAAPPAMLVSARVAGVAIFGPGLSSSAVPARIRLVIAAALGLAIFPLVAAKGSPPADHQPFQLLAFAPLLGMELALGAAIGFLASLPLAAAHGGGLIAGQQLGIGFAQLFNPALDDETDIFGQLFLLMALVAFLLLGGIEQMLLALMHSFDYVAPGGFRPGTDFAGLLSGMLLATLELALRIAAPLLAIILLETIVTGFLARSIPQINILSIGFALRIVVGLLVLAIGLVATQEVLAGSIGTMLDSLHEWMTTSAGGSTDG
jgi:flagellar biosynthetic protein FliR